jgi:hypothetical protein
MFPIRSLTPRQATGNALAAGFKDLAESFQLTANPEDAINFIGDDTFITYWLPS